MLNTIVCPSRQHQTLQNKEVCILDKGLALPRGPGYSTFIYDFGGAWLGRHAYCIYLGVQEMLSFPGICGLVPGSQHGEKRVGDSSSSRGLQAQVPVCNTHPAHR